MSRRDLEFSLEWLEKARHDLFTVDKLAADADSPGDILAFHCQQAIEKSVKGLLTAHGVKFPRTHDLVELLELSLPHLPSLEVWRDEFMRISHYAITVRYPDSVLEVDGATLNRAVKTAWEVFRTVDSHLINLRREENRSE